MLDANANREVDTGHWIPTGHPLISTLRVLPHTAGCRNLCNRTTTELDMREGTGAR